MNLDNPIWKVWLSSTYDNRAMFLNMLKEHYDTQLKEHICECSKCKGGKGDDKE